MTINVQTVHCFVNETHLADDVHEHQHIQPADGFSSDEVLFDNETYIVDDVSENQQNQPVAVDTRVADDGMRESSGAAASYTGHRRRLRGKQPMPRKLVQGVGADELARACNGPDGAGSSTGHAADVGAEFCQVQGVAYLHRCFEKIIG